jgi:hypothetical protein
MYYHPPSNTYLTPGNAFTLDGIQYPANWLTLSSPEEKAAINLQEVLPTNAPEDDRFYWVSSTLDKASITYVNTPKDLTALIEQQLSALKQQTFSMLQPTDYVEVRNIRDPKYKPECIQWRNEVLQYSRTLSASIQAASTVADLVLLVKEASWPTLAEQAPVTPSFSTTTAD